MQQTQRTVTKIVPNIIVMQETKKIRIAAYCRVSTDSSDQEHSFAAQVKYYTEMIIISKMICAKSPNVFYG